MPAPSTSRALSKFHNLHGYMRLDTPSDTQFLRANRYGPRRSETRVAANICASKVPHMDWIAGQEHMITAYHQESERTPSSLSARSAVKQRSSACAAAPCPALRTRCHVADCGGAAAPLTRSAASLLPAASPGTPRAMNVRCERVRSACDLTVGRCLVSPRSFRLFG